MKAFALIVVLWTTPCAGDKERARHFFDLGNAQYALRHYQEAIVEFEAGYLEEHEPAFLYNLGQAHRMLHHAEQGIHFYREYLELVPKAPDRAVIEGYIAELERPAMTAPPAPEAAAQ